MKNVNPSAIVIAGMAILALLLAVPISWFLEKDSTSRGHPANSFSLPHTTTYDPGDRSSTSTR